MRRGKVDGPCRAESDLPRPLSPSLVAARMAHTFGFRRLLLARSKHSHQCMSVSAKTRIKCIGKLASKLVHHKQFMHWVGFEFSCCDDVSTFDFDFVPVADVADLLGNQPDHHDD